VDAEALRSGTRWNALPFFAFLTNFWHARANHPLSDCYVSAFFFSAEFAASRSRMLEQIDPCAPSLKEDFHFGPPEYFFLVLFGANPLTLRRLQISLSPTRGVPILNRLSFLLSSSPWGVPPSRLFFLISSGDQFSYCISGKLGIFGFSTSISFFFSRLSHQLEIFFSPGSLFPAGSPDSRWVARRTNRGNSHFFPLRALISPPLRTFRLVGHRQNVLLPRR